MSYNSKYSGQQVEDLLDQVASGNAGGGGGITTETDPVFSASPAAKITDENISSWNNKVDKEDGKQLSTEDFTTLLKQKLDGLSNYDDTEISQAVSKLRTDLDTLVSGDTTTAIKTFNEVIAFLNGISDTEDLSGIISSIEQQIAAKQDEITDLQTIREGAAKGATALQSEQYKGTVTSVKINGTTKTPDTNGIVNLGTIEGGGGSSSGGNYPMEHIEVVNGECYVNPNTYSIITITKDIVIHLNPPTNENIYNEYFLEIFMSGEYAVTFDGIYNGLIWASGLGEPTFEANDEIQISIDSGGYALWTKFL